MSPGELTEATVRYLDAMTSLPAAGDDWSMAVGGEPFSAFERAARGAYLNAEPELTSAVMSDCLRTVADAYSPDLGD